MKCIVKSICLFGNDETKRVLNLHDGLNIITGDSKTGKSSLIEIVDYCLFSSRSGIPKGIITDYTNVFAIVLLLSEKSLVIGRYSPNSTKSNKSIISVESKDFSISDVDVSYITSKTEYTRKNAQAELERYFGMSVLSMSSENDEENKKGKASMRSFVSLLFQHQNLIASKHAMFYRFDDFIRRQRTIEEFPVYLGWVDGKYYLLKRELEELKKQQKAEEKVQKNLKAKDITVRKQLRNLIEQYYAVLGIVRDKEIDVLNYDRVIDELPNFNDRAYQANESQILLFRLLEQRESLNETLSEAISKIETLEKSQLDADHYGRSLKRIDSRTNLQSEVREVTCPLCENKANSVTSKLQAVITSKIKLEEELSKLTYYSQDTSIQLEELRKARQTTKKEIQELNSNIRQIEKHIENRDNDIKLRDRVNQFRGAIKILAHQVLSSKNQYYDGAELYEIQDKIDGIERELAGYSVDVHHREASTFISSKMNFICQKLDFEEELKPVNLQFSTSDFSFFHIHKRTRITLSEMGSGANWLACHLSLFLAILWYNCSQNTSAVPSFLFLDQPSQVYFPKDFNMDEQSSEEENIKQVQNIFNVILDVIDNIFQDTGFKPQIVVTEHADRLMLEKYNFEDFVIARWARDGNKLV